MKMILSCAGLALALLSPGASAAEPAAPNEKGSAAAAAEPNAAVLAAAKKAFTGFEKNSRADLVAVLDDNVVFEFSDSLPYGGTYNGKKEFQAFWAHVYKEYEYFNYDARDFLQSGDYLLVPVIARAKTKTGFSMENEHLFLFRIKEGKIVYGRIYADTARGRDVLEGHQPKKFPKIVLQ